MGRIQLILTEGVLREASDLQASACKITFDGLRDVVAFSFQHAPQGECIVSGRPRLTRNAQMFSSILVLHGLTRGFSRPRPKAHGNLVPSAHALSVSLAMKRMPIRPNDLPEVVTTFGRVLRARLISHIEHMPSDLDQAQILGSALFRRVTALMFTV